MGGSSSPLGDYCAAPSSGRGSSAMTFGKERCTNQKVTVVAVEASTGTTVKVDERVYKGQYLGRAPGFKGNVYSPCSGTVRQINFVADNHTLQIIICKCGGGAGLCCCPALREDRSCSYLYRNLKSR